MSPAMERRMQYKQLLSKLQIAPIKSRYVRDSSESSCNKYSSALHAYARCLINQTVTQRVSRVPRSAARFKITQRHYVPTFSTLSGPLCFSQIHCLPVSGWDHCSSRDLAGSLANWTLRRIPITPSVAVGYLARSVSRFIVLIPGNGSGSVCIVIERIDNGHLRDASLLSCL